MNTKMLRCLPAVLAMLGAGCASNQDLPLIFGSSNTIGIMIGGSVPEQGGEFIIGYKGVDFAFVPVTVVQPDGAEKQIGSEQPNDVNDAYSVLGQFGARAGRSGTAPRAGLGKFFATGLAARTLSDGFARRLGDGRQSNDCKFPTVSGNQPKKSDIEGTIQLVQHGGPVRRDPVRPGAVMLFTQYESLGFYIGASTTQQGGDLSLGLKDRNFAIIPIVSRDSDGTPDQIRSAAGNWLDALSVLGQFEFESDGDAGSRDAVLGKFFSTGSSARRLSEGFRVRLCEEYEPVSKPRPLGQPVTGSGK